MVQDYFATDFYCHEYGHFACGPNYNPSADPWIALDPDGNSPTPADVNGDGKTDLIRAKRWGPEANSFELLVLYSQGDGTFVETATGSSLEWSEPDTSNLVADIDSDGRADVITLNRMSETETEIRVAYGLGDASFEWVNHGTYSGLSWPLGEIPQTGAILAVKTWGVGDLNGDGLLDLIGAAYESGAVTLQYAITKPQRSGFQTGSQATPWDWEPRNDDKAGLSFAVGDLNGDGMADIARTDGYYLWMTGVVEVHVALSRGGAGGFHLEHSVVSLPPGNFVVVPTLLGDLNADGKDELVLVPDYESHDAEPLLVLFRQPDGSFVQRFTQPVSSFSSTFGPYADYPYFDIDIWGRSFIADMSGDGVADLIQMRSCVGCTDEDLAVLALPSKAQPDLITSLQNGIGGQTDVHYVASSHWQNQYLPPGFSVPTVESLTTSDGRGQSATTHYTYEGGLWSVEERRFLGFRRVSTVVDGTGATVETFYLQEEGSIAKPEFVFVKDGTGAILHATEFRYLPNDVDPPFTSLLTDRFDYECNGVAVVDPEDFDELCRTLLTQWAYDAYGRATHQYEHGVYPDLDEDDERTTAWTYFSNFTTYLLTHIQDTFVHDGLGTAAPLVRRTTWLKDGTTWEPITEIQGNGFSSYSVMDYLRDTHGNVWRVLDHSNTNVTITYDPTYHIFPVQRCNHLGQCRAIAWDYVLGRETAITDENNQVTSFEYDAFGRLTDVHHPDGGTDTYDYLDYGDPNLQRTRVVEGIGPGSGGLWSEIYRDGLGRHYKTVVEGGFTKQKEYNGVLTRVWKESLWHAAGGPIKYVEFLYDSANRLRFVHNPDHTVGEPSRREVQYGNGYRDVFDELGHQRRIWNDGLGRVTKVREYGGPGGPYDTLYDYDAADNVVTSVDAEGKVSTFTWNHHDRKTQACVTGMGCWSFSYQNRGLLKNQTDAKGQTISFTYDVLGRLKTKTLPGGSQVKWYYDEAGHGFSAGRLTRVDYLPAGSASYVYDEMGRVEEETRCVGAVCKTVAATYDVLDRLETLRYPDLETLTYGYNTAGRLSSVTGSQGVNYVDALVWSPAGQLVSIDFANGTVASYSYDPDREWLDSAQVQNGQGTLYSAAYTIDPAARIEQVEVNRGAGVATWDYGYDALDRLTSLNLSGAGGPVSETYQYGSTGNILAKGSLGPYEYNDPQRPQAVSRIGQTGFTYDLNGNLTAKGDCPPTGPCSPLTPRALYSFDAENRLAQYTNATTGQTTTYQYSPGGRRIRASGPSGTRLFFGDLVEAKDAAGSDEVYYYYAGPMRVAMKDSTGRYWYHHDHLGSVRLVTDQSGAQVEAKDFLPFGELASGSGSVSSPWDFAGHRTDGESGLVYMNARYYDPEIGRFLSPDTIVPDALNPQSLNRYAYVGNNPISNVDPTGHFSEGRGGFLGFIVALFRIGTSHRHHTKHLSRQASVGGGSVRSPEVAAQGGHMLGFQSGYGKYWASSVFGARAASGVSEASPLHDIVRTAVIWALQRGVIRAAGDRAMHTGRSESAAIERASAGQDTGGASPTRTSSGEVHDEFFWGAGAVETTPHEPSPGDTAASVELELNVVGRRFTRIITRTTLSGDIVEIDKEAAKRSGRLRRSSAGFEYIVGGERPIVVLGRTQGIAVGAVTSQHSARFAPFAKVGTASLTLRGSTPTSTMTGRVDFNLNTRAYVDAVIGR
jgi:RHS repeat-associated protein